MKQRLKKPELNEIAYNWVISNIQVQPQQSTILLKFLAMLPYATNYMIYAILIQLIFSPELATSLVPEKFFYANLIFRAVATLLFVFLQKVPFLVADKIGMLLSLIVFSKSNQTYSLYVFTIEVFGAFVYTLTKEKRVGNLDSRLQLAPLFQKQLVFIMIIAFCNFATEQQDKVWILMLCFLCNFYLSKIEIIYEQKFKFSLIMADIWLLISLTYRAIFMFMGKEINFGVFIVADAVTLTFCGFLIILQQLNFSLIYDTKLTNPSKKSEESLLNYFIKFSNLASYASTQEINIFVSYHKSICQDVHCIMTQCDDVTKGDGNRQNVRILLEKQLTEVSKSRQKLNEFLIYVLSPSDKVYKYLDLGKGNYFLKRELFRIEKQRKLLQDHDIKVISLKKNETRVKSDLLNYLKYAKRFWGGLNMIKIDGLEVIQDAMEMMSHLEKIKDTVNRNEELSPISRSHVNNFVKYLLNENGQYLANVKNPPYFMKDVEEPKPTLIIAAEGKNFSQIIDANTAITKLLYFPRDVICTLKIEDLIPFPFQEVHSNHMSNIRKKDSSAVKQMKNTVFVQNKMNYAVTFKTVIYALSAVSGKKWCVTLEKVYQNQPVLIVLKDGTIIGVTEPVMQMNFDNSIYGKKFTEAITQEMKNKVGTVVRIGEDCPIFRDSDKTSLKKIYLKKREEVFYYFRYLIVEIGFKKNFNHKELKRKTVVCGPQSTFKPLTLSKSRFEFHRHLDGTIRTYQQNFFNTEKKIEELDKTFGTKFEKKWTLKNWGEDIIEMRYINGVLDYVENMDVEEFDQIHHTNKEVEQVRFENTQAFYKETLKIRSEKSPKWLIKLRIIFVILIVLMIGLSTVIFILVRQNIQQSASEYKIVNLYSNKFVKMIDLGVISLSKIFPYHWDRNQSMDEILEAIQTSQLRLAQMTDLVQQMTKNSYVEEYTEKFQQRENLIEIQQGYNIQISQYLNDPNYPYEDILARLIYGIVPGKIFILNSLEIIYTKDALKRDIILGSIMLVFGLLIFGIGFGLYLSFTMFFMNQKVSVIKILSNLKCRTIQLMENRLKKFENYIYFDTDVANAFGSQEEVKEKIEILQKSRFKFNSNPEQNSENTQKQEEQVKRKVLNMSSEISLAFLTLLWLVSYALLLLFLAYQSYLFRMVEINAISSIKSFSETIVVSKMIWIKFNYFPQDYQSLNRYEQFLFKSEKKFHDRILQGFSRNYFSEDYRTFYHKFWNENGCEYIKQTVPTCHTDFNGALNEGMVQIFAFLNRKFNYLKAHRYSRQEFYRINVISQLLNIQMKYLNPIQKIVNQKIDYEFANLHRSYLNITVSIYAVNFVIIFLGILIYKSLSSNSDFLTQLQKILSVVPYNDLIEIHEFRKYAKEKLDEEVK